MRRTLVAFCLLALASVVFVSPALADPGRGANVLCYFWAHNPSPAIGTPYVPSSTYSYNTVGRAGANFVTKRSTGVYSVACNGVGGGTLWGPGGHVQVSAYGPGNRNNCHVDFWSTGVPNFSAQVSCYNPAGNPADSRFDFLFIW
jgi:hypothetical protein